MYLGVLALVLALLATPLGADAQQAGKVPKVGYLSAQAPGADSASRAAFLEGLREHGYVEGRNVAIEWRFADGDMARCPMLAAELVRLNVDVISVQATPCVIATKKVAGMIPIVFTAVADPVALGLVASLARPGGNATGVTNVHPELTQRRLALLKELVPTMLRIGLLKPPAAPHAPAIQEEMEAAAKVLSLELWVEEVKGIDGFDSALGAMKKARVDAVMLVPHPLFYTHRARLVEASMTARLPLMGWTREFADAGAPLTYGISGPWMFRRAAGHVARILQGAKPTDLPVERPTKFELVINNKTAKALHLTIPPALLLQADQVIE